MKLRAAIFDLYGTLLEVGPPPANAPARWAARWREAFGAPPRLSLPEFEAAARDVVDAEHAAARARGIAHPEVFWPDVVAAVLPELAQLPATARARSPLCGADLQHTVRLMPGAADAIGAARRAQLRLGLASNCQPYSLRELDDALAGTGLARDAFEPALSFLSFEHGFSKPDPHVFRLLTARLRTLGIAPEEALMIGDRPDNDLEPARAHRWQTFHIHSTDAACWEQLCGRLVGNSPPSDP